MVDIDTRTGSLQAKVWLMQVGRVPLYLLDCDVEGNSPEERELTSRLYGGDDRTRIRQELVLGVGGVQALAALGIHARRVSPQRRTQRLRRLGSGPSSGCVDDGLSFDDAARQTARMSCFTTHTPVPAGHDRFPG